MSTSAAQQWRNKNKLVREIELPSGNTAQIKRIPITKFMSAGVIPDSLMPMVTAQLGKDQDKPAKKGKASEEVDFKEIAKDPVKLAEMFLTIDKIAAMAFVEPQVKLHLDDDGNEIPQSDRDEDFIYTDELDLDDKMLVFNYSVGGSEDVEPFRKGSK